MTSNEKNEIDYCDFLTKQMFFLHLHRDFVLIVISPQDMRGVCVAGWQNCVEMEQKGLRGIEGAIQRSHRGRGIG